MLIFASCKPTRHLQEGEYLISKNKIKGVNNRMERELERFIKTKANTRFLGVVKWKLWRNALSKKGDKGEPPAVFDSAQAAKTERLMEGYLKNNGYYNADVTFEAKKKGKKRRVIIYRVDEGRQYTIRNIEFDEIPQEISTILLRSDETSLLEKGEPYRLSVLEEERGRIATLMRNEGYYLFNKENIYFNVDSTLGSFQVDIFMNITEGNDPKTLEQFKLRDIYVIPEYSFFRSDTLKKDTLIRKGIYFVTNDPEKYDWDLISRKIFFESGDKFSFQENFDLTYQYIADLGIFSYIDIRFDQVGKDMEGYNQLDAKIYLSPLKKKEISIELEGNTGPSAFGPGSALGTVVQLSYKNRNLFRGAELLSLGINGGVETQLNSGFSINTFDINTQASLTVPQFWAPVNQDSISKFYNAKTRFSISNNYQERIQQESNNIVLNNTNISFSYDWNEFSTKRHIFSPLAISYIQIRYDSNSARSEILRRSLRNQWILGSAYSFIYNNQKLVSDDNFWYFIGNTELTGNTLFAANELVNAITDSDSRFRILGVDYSQYIKVEGDLRRYFMLAGRQQFVTRISGGVGVPYGNVDVLPYLKQFFVGGANSMRAWNMRRLGPGPYRDTSTTATFLGDQTGDIKLEGNMEYRFAISNLFKGALFVDAGNIWTLNETRSGSTLKDFAKEIAVGTGVGLRVDFSFLIFRFDVGMKLREPALQSSNKWVIRHLGDRSNWRGQSGLENEYSLFNYNIAIGYPF